MRRKILLVNIAISVLSEGRNLLYYFSTILFILDKKNF
jgi:hypothetical protein